MENPVGGIFHASYAPVKPGMFWKGLRSEFKKNHLDSGRHSFRASHHLLYPHHTGRSTSLKESQRQSNESAGGEGQTYQNDMRNIVRYVFFILIQILPP